MTLDDIDYILNDKFIASDQSFLTDKNEKGKTILNTKVSFDGLRNCTYRIYRFDPNNNEIFPFFSTKKGTNIRDICDFFIFVQHKGKLYVLIVEHKSGSGSSTTQLDASKCFIDYIRSTAKRLGRDEKCIIIKVRLHILHKSLNKTSRPKYEKDILCYFWQDFRIKAIIETKLV